ncbi:ComF family protein [Candidatus Parcubacteria bacterium]|nr:ComF family protein [Candidatus Parcubacteria bacterium]
MKIDENKDFLTDLLFPKFCFNCGKEGNYLCPDCFALIDVLEYQFCLVCGKRVIDGKTCLRCRPKTRLDGFYFAVSYQNKLIKKLISQFKYKPFIKDLSKTLASLIITHFYLSNKFVFFTSEKSILVSVPLNRKKLKLRGFNQSEEIARELSQSLEIPLVKQGLIKIKNTRAQIELSKEQRKENIRGAFLCRDEKQIKNKKIFLVDDVFTTGATMEECAKVLKSAGAREVWAITVAKE